MVVDYLAVWILWQITNRYQEIITTRHQEPRTNRHQEYYEKSLLMNELTTQTNLMANSLF